MYKCIKCKQTTVVNGICAACGEYGQNKAPAWIAMPIIFIVVVSIIIISNLLNLYIKLRGLS